MQLQHAVHGTLLVYIYIFPNFTYDPGQRDPNNGQRLDFAKLGCYSIIGGVSQRGVSFELAQGTLVG